MKKLKSSTEKLLDALAEMLKRMPIDQVKISELLKISSVSHSTFYRNFPTKDDFYSWVLKYYLNGLSSMSFKNAATPEDFYTHYFNFIYDNRLFFKTFANQAIWPQFNYYLYQMGVERYSVILKQAYKSPKDANLISNYVVHAHVGVVLEWLKEEPMTRPEILVSRVTAMTKAALSSQKIDMNKLFPNNFNKSSNYS